jgi:tellurium resistance protein TerD
MADTISMSKGETVSLTKAVPGLTKVFVGAGWDAKKDGSTMDLDLAAFLLDENGKLSGAANFVYYGHKKSGDGAVASRGDNLPGEGEGDDEVIDVDLSKVASNIKEIVFVVSIYQAAQKGQSLKNLDNAFIRTVNNDDQKELAKYDISHSGRAWAAARTSGFR